MTENSGFHIEADLGMIRTNRSGGAVRVALATINDARLVDCRIMFVPEGQKEYRGSKKGFAVSVRKLDDLISALTSAKRKAVELGWLNDDRKAA